MRALRDVLTRVGFCALGAVYAAVGYLAIRVGFEGARDRVTGFRGSFLYLMHRPHGSILVAGIAAGLAAFALGKLLDAGDRKRAWPARIGSLVVAIGHAILSWGAIALLLRIRRGPDTRSLLGWILAKSWGPAVLQAAGIAVIVIGAIQIVQGVTGRLPRLPSRGRLGAATPMLLRVGRIGYVARGVVSAIVGWFLIRTARDIDPRHYHDIGAALGVIERMRFGGVLLVVAGAGLVAYGAYLAVLGLFSRPA